MKIAFYDPYLDTMGGGERYFLQAAVYLQQQSHEISFFWKPIHKEEIMIMAKNRFNLDLSDFNFINDIFSKKVNIFDRYQATKDFDVLFYLSDGSIPFLFSKKNILMFQHPINWVKIMPIDTLKLSLINKIICNSEFVKQHIDHKLGNRKTILIYPAVSNLKRQGSKKEKTILSIGRFTGSMNAKKQDLLIESFKKIHTFHQDWELILAGGVREDDRSMVDNLRLLATGLPVRIQENVDYQTLIELYNKCSIYWHATGFGEDITLHPEKTEHFGISVVEAMSAGCVPVVFNAGGLSEIVANDKYGLTWKTLDEMIAKTKNLIEDKQLFGDYSKKAEIRSLDFGDDKFFDAINKLILL